MNTLVAVQPEIQHRAVRTAQILEFSHAKKPTYFSRFLEVKDTDVEVEYSFRVPDTKIIDYDLEDSVAVSDLPILAYFVYDCEKNACEADKNGNVFPSGIYMKISKRISILLVNGFDANIPEDDDLEYEYGEEGTQITLPKDSLVKVVNCDINFRG